MADLPADAISRLEPELAFLVRRLEMNYRKRGYPMERAHYLLLGRLEQGEKSTGEIAEALGLDHSTVVRQVAAVEDLGFAERRPNPRDRRSVLVGLTPVGAASIVAMREARQGRLGRIPRRLERGRARRVCRPARAVQRGVARGRPGGAYRRLRNISA